MLLIIAIKIQFQLRLATPDESGKFNQETYQSLQKLVRSLMDTYDLDKEDVIRHYDVTGKICPKYFVDHEDAWQIFLNSL